MVHGCYRQRHRTCATDERRDTHPDLEIMMPLDLRIEMSVFALAMFGFFLGTIGYTSVERPRLGWWFGWGLVVSLIVLGLTTVIIAMKMIWRS